MPEPNDLFAVKVVSTARLIPDASNPSINNNGFTLRGPMENLNGLYATTNPLDGAGDPGLSEQFSLVVGDYIILKDQAGNDTTAHVENGLWQVKNLGVPMLEPWVLQRCTPGGNLKLNELFYTTCGETHIGEVWRLVEADNSPSTTASGITAGATKLRFTEGPLQATKLQGDVCTDDQPGCKILENGDAFSSSDAASWFRGDVLSLGPDCDTPGAEVVNVGETPELSEVCAGKIKGGALAAGLAAIQIDGDGPDFPAAPLTNKVSAVALTAGTFTGMTGPNLLLSDVVPEPCEGQQLVIRNISGESVNVVTLESGDLSLPDGNGVVLLYAAGAWHIVSDLADTLSGDILADDGTKILENGTDGTDAWLLGNVKAEDLADILVSGVDCESSTLSVGNTTLKGTLVTNGPSITATSGPAAVPITGTLHEITTTGTGDALTLADGVAGQRLSIIYVAEAAGADTAILTPTTLAGTSTTITFNNLGDTADLVFSATGGWYVLGGSAVLA